VRERCSWRFLRGKLDRLPEVRLLEAFERGAGEQQEADAQGERPVTVEEAGPGGGVKAEEAGEVTVRELAFT
jgi:hypothetical protein